MAVVALILIVGLALGFANGGNDQFKGVATLYGSGVTRFRNALAWATFTSALGSIAVLYFGQGLIAAFSGKGLVPDPVVAMKSFSLAVGMGAAATVLLATSFKLPISTTHALVGSLVGAGFLASPSGVNLHQLLGTFVTPLLISPVLSAVMFLAVYPLLHQIRVKCGVTRETCVCVGTEVVAMAPAAATLAEARAMLAANAFPTITAGTEAACIDRYQGNLLGIQAGRAIDAAHYLSAGAVCLSRAMNDVPKMAAILLIGGAFSPGWAVAAVATAMLVGGLVQSRNIADTMSENLTAMNPGQGLTANLVTSGVVLFASRLGLPVSTTHVACGSIFGLGSANGGLNKELLRKILLAWVVTLPCGAILSGFFFLAFRNLF